MSRYMEMILHYNLSNHVIIIQTPKSHGKSNKEKRGWRVEGAFGRLWFCPVTAPLTTCFVAMSGVVRLELADAEEKCISSGTLLTMDEADEGDRPATTFGGLGT